jgi:hypothetical protein
MLVHVALSPAPARKGPGAAPPDAVNQGVGAVKKFIRDLGN